MPVRKETLAQLKNRMREASKSKLKQSKQETEIEKQNLLLKRETLNKQKIQLQQEQKQLEKNTLHTDIDIQIEQLQTEQFNVNEELKQEQVKIDQTIEHLKQKGRQLKDDFNQTNQELGSKLVKLLAAKSQEFETKQRDLKPLEERKRHLNDKIQNCTTQIDDITREQKQIKKGLEDVPILSTYVRTRGYLPDHEQNTIRENWCDLLDQIRNPLYLVQTLYNKGVFDDDDCGRVKRIYKEYGTRQATGEILTKIADCGPGALSTFVHCLTSECLIGVDEQQIAGEAKLILEETENNNYPQTRAYHEACGILQEHLVVGVIGATGDGKSTLARMVANNFIQKTPEFLPIIIRDPSEIPFDSSRNCLLIIDDMMGLYNISEEKKTTWSDVFSRLVIKQESKQFALIYIMRDYIYNEINYLLRNCKIFSNRYCVFLYHDQLRLNDSERKDILKYHKTTLDDATLTTIVDQMSICVGFPRIAESLGAVSDDCPSDICKTLYDFLNSSFEIFRNDHKLIYFCICLIFCKPLLPKSQLDIKSPDLLKLSEELEQHVDKIFNLSDVLRNCKRLSNSFLEAEVKHKGTDYILRRLVEEAFLVYCHKYSPVMAIMFSPIKLLMEKIRTKTSSQTPYICHVQQDYFPSLLQRFITEIESTNYRVLFHQAFLDERFLNHCMNKESSDTLFNLNYIPLDYPNITNDTGSFLHYICLMGNSECLKTLLPHVSDNLLTGKSKHGHTVVELAVLSNIDRNVKCDLLSHEKYHHLLPPKTHISAVESISREFRNQVSRGSGRNNRDIDVTDHGEIICHLLAKVNYEYTIDHFDWMFHNGLDINHQNSNSDTSLMIGAFLHNVNFLEVLTQHPAIDINIQNNKGHTALHGCILGCIMYIQSIKQRQEDAVVQYYGTQIYPLYLRCVDILLGALADVNIQDNMGITTLMLAARENDKIMTRKLLDAGARIDLHDISGYVALQYLDMYENIYDLTCFQLLLTGSGSNILDLPCIHGDTFIQTALRFPPYWGAHEVASFVRLLVYYNCSLQILKSQFGGSYYNSIELDEFSSEHRYKLRQLLYLSGAPEEEITSVLDVQVEAEAGNNVDTSYSRNRVIYNKFCFGVSLQSKCRRVMRQHLGLEIKEKITELGIPHLNEFLLFKHVLPVTEDGILGDFTELSDDYDYSSFVLDKYRDDDCSHYEYELSPLLTFDEANRKRRKTSHMV